MASKIEAEIELKTTAEKMWNNLKQFATVFPKALPHVFERIDVLEGDGKSVGSVVLVTYTHTESNPFLTAAKEKIELLDDEKKIMSYSVMEGDMLNYCKNFKGLFCVSSKSEGAIVKYSAEFDDANGQVPVHGLLLALQDLDTYLLKSKDD